jgi:hypothetical protein
MAEAVTATCRNCGRPLDEHNRRIRFKLPEPMSAIPKEERDERTWGNDILMHVKDLHEEWPHESVLAAIAPYEGSKDAV